MSVKRISQETFDEVVQENIDDFDMDKEEALKDAVQQFMKQGINLSNIDTTNGEGRKEALGTFKSLQETPIPSPNPEATLASVRFLSGLCNKSHRLYRRNVMLMYHQGGLNSIHHHLDAREDSSIQFEVIKLLNELSSSHLDIRDFFEPNGSSKLAGILEQALNNISSTSSSDSENQSANYKLLECIIALARTVAKSERNKTALMKANFGPLLTQLVGSHVKYVTNSVTDEGPKARILQILEKSCYLLRELSIHNDMRSETSCAFENGKFFLKQQDFVPQLISIVREYDTYPHLASAALLATKAMITTNEAVQVVSLHGIVELLSHMLVVFSDSANVTITTSTSDSASATQETEAEQEEREADESNSAEGSGSLKGPAQNNRPAILLRAIVAVVRNMLADDLKKELFVQNNGLNALLMILINSQSNSTSLLASYLNTDYYLVEHLFGCLAQFSLRSPSNSKKIMENYSTFLPIVLKFMNKYYDRESLHRQICLMLHNIINRCDEYKQVLLDYNFESTLRNVSGMMPTVKDESYVLLRDLGISIQYVKMDENGNIVPVYEMFGSQPKLNFRPIYDEADDFNNRMVEEARAPLPRPPADTFVDAPAAPTDHGHDHAHGSGNSHDSHEGGCCGGDDHSHDHNHDHDHHH